ncbi:PREDICTED: probable kinetochore protein nuf2 [Dinoponera quadriceps]|uniref:Probable kinetochore protein nuf2 n=1 Tax=Dinoponera quadriceps TaxID=609295 RepID=A0A6P3WSU2_DINQU|nr:PREDICTED: probable kinetochore protein nuf2 [Dinoponera quadriceps]
MDTDVNKMPVNKIHRILLDAGLPSTIEDLKNPAEQYIMMLLTSFLSQFGINMNLIDQPTAEQCAIMTYFKDSDIISLINLHTALTQIFNKIFLEDFHITDITNPGQKRLRRQAKFLANFVLYAMQKKIDIKDRMDEVHARSKLLEELKDKKTQIVESINDKALHKAKQLSLMKKLENDIQHVQSKIEKNNKRELELELIKNKAEKGNHKAKELCRSVKATVMKLSKEIDDLQSEVVYSPEEFRSRLNELEEQKNVKIEERDIMQEAIQDKKQSMKQIGAELDIIQKVNDELTALKIIYEQLMNQKTQSDNIKKQIESLNNMRNEQQSKLSMLKSQTDSEVNELKSYRKEDIVKLDDLYKQLLSEKNSKKTQLDARKVYFNEKCLERNKLKEEIRRKEEVSAALVQNFQGIYDNEIADELKLRKAYREL